MSLDSRYFQRRLIVSLCLAATFLIASLAVKEARADFVFTNFDGPPPNAGGVQLSGINNNGAILGVVLDANFNEQGFIRNAAGSITPFALPNGSVNDPFQTQLGGINDNDVVVGYLPTSPGLPGNPLLVFQNGVVTDRITLPPEFGGTSVRGINNAGVMAGSVNDLVAHKPRGYVRNTAGIFTKFDATPTTLFTAAQGINNNGTIVGVYSVLNAITAGFERSADGTITLLPTPATIGGIAVVTINYNKINDSGVTVGSFQDPTPAFFGFVRDAQGNFTLVQSPDSPNNSGLLGINNGGTVAGTFIGAAGAARPFLAVPGDNGDLNCNGTKDGEDLQDFVLALLNPAAFIAVHPNCPILNGDFTGDRHLEVDDVPGMVNCLLNGFCP